MICTSQKKEKKKKIRRLLQRKGNQKPKTMIRRKNKYFKYFKDLIRSNLVEKLIIITIFIPKKAHQEQNMVIALI